jgi:mannitol-1-phosphate/altronate dehydrogenase
MKDPMLDQLKAAAAAGGKDPGRLLAMRQLFSEEVATDPRFVKEVEVALASFYDKGTAATLEEYVG